MEEKDRIDEASLPDEVYLDANGWYRWTYYMDRKTNRSYLYLYMKIFALVILIPGAILFFMIYGRDFTGAGGYLLIWMAILAGAELLTWLIYVLIDKLNGGTTPISYAMDGELVKVHAESTKTPPYYLETVFSDVREVKFRPETDEIVLCELLRVMQVYVPPAAIPFVLGFIRDHVPPSAKIKE